MAGLLVSVRSLEEARTAVEGGASVVDVKEPARGPLGMASPETWRLVREVVPPEIPVSVALGELRDWPGRVGSLEGVSFRKLGLAGSALDWRARWAAIRRLDPTGPRWVAVVYADWRVAGAPEPSKLLDEALTLRECSGVLVDTWDKSRPSPLDATSEWFERLERIRSAGRFVALAGGLDLASIRRLSPLEPDLFAVRGAACDRSDRTGVVSLERVLELARAARRDVSSRPDPS